MSAEALQLILEPLVTNESVLGTGQRRALWAGDPVSTRQQKWESEYPGKEDERSAINFRISKVGERTRIKNEYICT